ncbi:RNA polymerase sigma factor [Aquisphaera insulae]|uniref:RNA polymerase sigma factor n=1 Tax=Aquisphaera insulae TaxID=2712864 RepID=UPI0013E9A210|nr:sigma-70 family RNA polymerase sigma factor [Aquisphaera insulae]
MERVKEEPRLCELSTNWTMLFRASHGTPEEVSDALKLMMLRYSGAVHRYLLKTVGDPDEVTELDQEFALRFLKGNFLKYDPTVGRFRDYVRGAVRNLMIDYHRRQTSSRKKIRHLDTDLEATIVGESGLEGLDEQVDQAWRDDLLDRAWESLAELESRTGQPYHTVLKHRVRHPDQKSAQMAAALSPALGRTLTSGAVRQLLQRARERWAASLIDEVKLSLDAPTRDNVEQELADLKLLHLCKPILDRIDLGKAAD